MQEAGDRVKITTKEEEIEGILMPEEKDFYVIKLDSGYNIGVDKRRVKEIKLIAKGKEKKVGLPKTKQREELPKVSILHTGGTIASKVDYETGGVIARFSPQELIDMFPEIKDIAKISSKLVRNMWSEDMRFGHYNILAREVDREIKNGAQGVIITHGTDTMHYTSAALAFILKDLPVPVVLVGAQRSSDRGSSDAALNLISAVFFIVASKNFAEVAVCMHESIDDENCVILPATKCRKLHSSRRDAFKAVNTMPWARVNFKQKKADFFKTGYSKRSDKKLRLMPFKESIKAALVKTYPGMHSDIVKNYEGYDGIVFEGTGLGHLPINEIDDLTKENKKIFEVIKELIKKGTVVAIASQTIFGAIDMNVYSTGRKMQDIGIIGNYTDMTPETAFIKLAWLLSNYPKEQAKELFGKNLVGEISERIEQI